MSTASWRDAIRIHPAADLFPLIGDDDLVALGEDIKRNGLTTRIVATVEDGKLVLLDGRNRLDAMERVGIDFKIVRKSRTKYHWKIETPDLNVDLNPNMNAVDDVDIVDCHPTEYVISANVHRRHLTANQKRDVIAKLLTEKPERSNRATAALAKVDDKTVGTVRREMEERAEIPHVSKVVDTKGRRQPTKQKATADNNDDQVDQQISPSAHVDRTTEQRVACIMLHVALKDLTRAIKAVGPKTVAAGVLPDELAELQSDLAVIEEWLSRFAVALAERDL